VDSEYTGEPITLMAAQDIPLFKAWGDIMWTVLGGWT